MKIVYISHPYGGQTQNLNEAKVWVKAACHHSYAPLAQWVLEAELWPHKEGEDLAYALLRDLRQVRASDEVWLCGKWRLSKGCQLEKAEAEKLGIKIRDMYYEIELDSAPMVTTKQSMEKQ